ncbi:MAG: hypothetical protein M1827_000413 [Pycnora praestabilis]|nr:MAG: hypothetical protein M1827_000413 [Pycnora praestabilis]
MQSGLAIHIDKQDGEDWDVLSSTSSGIDDRDFAPPIALTHGSQYVGSNTSPISLSWDERSGITSSRIDDNDGFLHPVSAFSLQSRSSQTKQCFVQEDPTKNSENNQAQLGQGVGLGITVAEAPPSRRLSSFPDIPHTGRLPSCDGQWECGSSVSSGIDDNGAESRNPSRLLYQGKTCRYQTTVEEAVEASCSRNSWEAKGETCSGIDNVGPLFPALPRTRDLEALGTNPSKQHGGSYFLLHRATISPQPVHSGTSSDPGSSFIDDIASTCQPKVTPFISKPQLDTGVGRSSHGGTIINTSQDGNGADNLDSFACHCPDSRSQVRRRERAHPAYQQPPLRHYKDLQRSLSAPIAKEPHCSDGLPLVNRVKDPALNAYYDQETGVTYIYNKMPFSRQGLRSPVALVEGQIIRPTKYKSPPTAAGRANTFQESLDSGVDVRSPGHLSPKSESSRPKDGVMGLEGC